MLPRLARATVTAILLLVLAWGSHAQKPNRSIWSGTSGGARITWTRSDLRASIAGQPAFSLRSVAERSFGLYRSAVEEAELGACVYERTFQVLSIVGPIVSFRDSVLTSCEQQAHPGGERRVTAVDLSRPGGVGYAVESDEPLAVDPSDPGKVISLADIFTEKELLSTLLADKVIKAGLVDTPERLADLPEAIRTEGLVSGGNPCPFTLPKDFLTRFAFHHLAGKSVAVRLELAPVGGACRSAQAQLGLLLPIPSSLETALRFANARKEGFLMKDQRRIAGDNIATLSFTVSVKAGRR